MRLEVNSESDESGEGEESEEDDDDENTFKVVDDPKLVDYKMESDMFTYDSKFTNDKRFKVLQYSDAIYRG